MQSQCLGVSTTSPVPEDVRRAADVLERRYAVSILYASHHGCTRFNEFRQALGTIPPATLAQRLAELEQRRRAPARGARRAPAARRVRADERRSAAQGRRSTRSPPGRAAYVPSEARVILPKVKRRQPERLADPYRDLDVIDSRAPRFNQIVVGTLALVAVRRGLAVAPRPPRSPAHRGPHASAGATASPASRTSSSSSRSSARAQLEDARPPRFANMVGVDVPHRGVPRVRLGGFEMHRRRSRHLVAALALLAATTGFCAGCEAYKLGHLLTGRRFVACPLPPRPSPAPRRLNKSSRGADRHLGERRAPRSRVLLRCRGAARSRTSRCRARPRTTTAGTSSSRSRPSSRRSSASRLNRPRSQAAVVPRRVQRALRRHRRRAVRDRARAGR